MKQLLRSAASLSGATRPALWRAGWSLCACAWLWSPGAQAAAPPRTPAAAATPEAQTPLGFDLPGYWVSIVTQNWRFRMVVPLRGDYAEIPINLKAKQFADAWNPAPDEAAGKQCEAYGAPAIMRVPERLHISWQDARTLVVQTDSGMQTRLLHFAPTAADAAAFASASWQGYSVAHWEVHMAPFAGPPRAGVKPQRQYGGMQVMTTHMLPGLLRKNGIPYSGKAQMSEYWEVNGEPDADQWLTVTTELQDPEYLQTPFYFTSIFQKEPDGSKWDPTPCSLTQ
ncbi:MAG TPA: hypothetical protein VMD56_09235 [Steroidobacteraceae bacterium]|nr:hypothetical protein [Steroidobacteraceae bacterium]